MAKNLTDEEIEELRADGVLTEEEIKQIDEGTYIAPQEGRDSGTQSSGISKSPEEISEMTIEDAVTFYKKEIDALNEKYKAIAYPAFNYAGMNMELKDSEMESIPDEAWDDFRSIADKYNKALGIGFDGIETHSLK